MAVNKVETNKDVNSDPVFFLASLPNFNPGRLADVRVILGGGWNSNSLLSVVSYGVNSSELNDDQRNIIYKVCNYVNWANIHPDLLADISFYHRITDSFLVSTEEQDLAHEAINLFEDDLVLGNLTMVINAARYLNQSVQQYLPASNLRLPNNDMFRIS